MDTSWRRVVLIALAGGALNLVIAAIATTVLGMTFGMPPGSPSPTIPLAMFAILTIAASLIGTAIARGLVRFGKRAVTFFVSAGTLVAVLSAIAPFTLPNTTATAAVMAGTHLVAAATFFLAARSSRSLGR